METRDIFSGLAALAAAIAVLVSVQSCINSERANRIADDATAIAKEANDIAYKYYIPSIISIQNLQNSDPNKNQAGEVVIYNAGGRVVDFRPNLYTLAVVDYANYMKNTYILISGYCDYPGQELLSREGVLWKYKVLNDGYLRYNAIQGQFNGSSSKALGDATLRLMLIMNSSYKDFTKTRSYNEYYDVLQSRSLASQDADKMISEANANNALAGSKLSLSLYDPNVSGEKLYAWWFSTLKK